MLEARIAQIEKEAEHKSIARKKISPEEVEKAYHRLIAHVPRTKQSCKKDPNMTAEQYLQMVRRPP